MQTKIRKNANKIKMQKLKSAEAVAIINYLRRKKNAVATMYGNSHMYVCTYVYEASLGEVLITVIAGNELTRLRAEDDCNMRATYRNLLFT